MKLGWASCQGSFCPNHSLLLAQIFLSCVLVPIWPRWLRKRRPFNLCLILPPAACPTAWHRDNLRDWRACWLQLKRWRRDDREDFWQVKFLVFFFVHPFSASFHQQKTEVLVGPVLLRGLTRLCQKKFFDWNGWWTPTDEGTIYEMNSSIAAFQEYVVLTFLGYWLFIFHLPSVNEKLLLIRGCIIALFEMSQVAGWRWGSFSWEAILTACDGLALLLNIPLNWWHWKGLRVIMDLGALAATRRSKVSIFMQLKDRCTYIVPFCTRSYHFHSISVQ